MKRHGGLSLDKSAGIFWISDDGDHDEDFPCGVVDCKTSLGPVEALLHRHEHKSNYQVVINKVQLIQR